MNPALPRWTPCNTDIKISAGPKGVQRGLLKRGGEGEKVVCPLPSLYLVPLVSCLTSYFTKHNKKKTSATQASYKTVPPKSRLFWETWRVTSGRKVEMFDKLIDITDTDASFFTNLDRLVFSASFSLTLYWGPTVIYIFIYTVQSIFAGIRIFQHLNFFIGPFRSYIRCSSSSRKVLFSNDSRKFQ